MAKKISKIDIVDVDIFKSIADSATTTQTKVDVLKTTLEAIAQLQKDIKSKAGKTKSDFGGVTPEAMKSQKTWNKHVEEGNRLYNESKRVTETKVRVTKALTVEEAKLKEELRKTNLEARQTARLQLAQEGSVEKLRAKLIILTREWDKLTDAERKNSDRGARLKKGIDETTASVTKLEVATGRHQRKVGNYGSALDGLKGKFRSLVGVASQFGVALGGVAILRSGISTVVEFDQAIADLSAITGAGGKDLQFFKDQAIELGKTTKGGASAVVEAYKLIGSAKPELLENADALNQVTEAAITLAKASGLDLPDAATRLTDAMNQFGAPAEKAGHFIDVLANGAKFGAAEIPQITDALLKFGAVAKTSNVSIEESTALIEALAEKGLKGAEAGTGLRNVMLKLSAPDALPKEAKDMLDKLGISFDKLKDTSLPFSERLKELKPLLTDNAALVKTFGTENAVVATTLLSNIDRVDELTVSMGNLGTAQEQADIRSKTLGEAFSNLGNSWNSFILSLTSSEGSTDGFRKFIDFLSNNIPKIIGYLVTLGKVFIVYKARLIAINVVNKLFGDGAKGMNLNLSQLTKNFKEGAKAGTGFGGAIKSIGWAAVISGAYALGVQIYDIAKGYRLARIEKIAFEKGTSQGSKAGQKEAEAFQKSLDEQLKKIKDNKNLTEKERVSQSLSETNRHKKLIEQKIAELRVNRDISRESRQDAKDKVKDLGNTESALESFRRSASEALGLSPVVAVDFTPEGQLEATTKNVAEYNAEIRALQLKYAELGSSTETLSTELDDLKKPIDGVAGSVEHLTEVIKFQSEAIEEQNRIISEGADDVAERLMRINDLEDERRINIAEIGVLNAEIGGDEEEIIKAKINLIEEELAVRTALMREGTVERVKLEKQAELDIKNLRQTNNKTNYDEQKKWLQLSEKLLTDNLDKKIALLDKELEARKTHADELRKLADDGNIKASESIAEEERLANEALIKKEKLEKRKQQIAMVSAFLQSYLTAVENGEKPGQALVTAGSDKAVLESFINSLPAFIEGTDTTVANSLGAPMMSGEDGHVIRVDGREKILNPELSGMTGNMTTGQIAKLSQDYLNGKLVSKMDGAQQTGGSYMDSNAIIKSIQGLEQTIKNKPEIEYNLEEVVQGLYSFTRKESKGNTVVYNKYRVKG
jgi:TP901 family phage tail tape measure protein